MLFLVPSGYLAMFLELQPAESQTEQILDTSYNNIKITMEAPDSWPECDNTVNEHQNQMTNAYKNMKE